MIRFLNVNKSFRSLHVLKDVSFDMPAGQIWFVLGVSGTGKSVLLKTIVGLLPVDSGSIFIENEDVTSFKESEWLAIRRKCGMVFQSPALFDSMTIFDNVAFGLRRHRPDLDPSEVRRKVSEILDWTQLAGTEEKFPAELSFGMQKRVSLARTVATEPKVLLFDEPTTGLDPVTTTAIDDLILALSRRLNTTSLVVSHDMASALKLADRILVLDQGRIVANETPGDLAQNSHPLVTEFLAEFPNSASIEDRA